VKTQNLIIYKYISLYHILDELNLDLNFKILLEENENSLKNRIRNLDNYLIISKKKSIDIKNLFVVNDLPNNIFKLLEKINLEFLRHHFNSQSEVKIKEYTINFNSRMMLNNQVTLKLTEKEINTIFYLSKSIKPISINELQNKVWSYQSDIETHTVETHIYRLRKKILNTFNDSEFIISKKNGYQIK